MQAIEDISLEEAAGKLPVDQIWMARVLGRLERAFGLRPGSRILDVGAAQGRSVIALEKLGYKARGVEPERRARQVAGQLAVANGTDPEAVVCGTADRLPFPDRSFEAVLACSLLEHVPDWSAAAAEAYRVLVPGGIFWFCTTSTLCPRQAEIRGFPAFGWYPNPWKRSIMRWALFHRPDLIGHTDSPAVNWLSPWKTRRLLHEAGFSGILDCWDLRGLDEGGSFHRLFLRIARSNPAAKFFAEILTAASAYAARKPGS
jgi:ubiquinone/menaquinone biosynthesis C-methylase UbiE